MARTWIFKTDLLHPYTGPMPARGSVILTLPRFRNFNGVALLLSLLIGSLGVSVLIGWAFDIATLKNVFPGFVTMKANTALGMVLSGGVLALVAREKVGLPLRCCITTLSGVIIALGMSTLGEYLFDWNSGIDELLFRDAIESVGTSQPGRMAPSSAFCFVLAGSALVIASQQNLLRLGFPILSALGATLAIIGAVASLGQISNALFHFRLWNYSGMAVVTAAGFMLLGIGLLALVESGSGMIWALDMTTTLGFIVAIAVMLTASGVSWTYTNQLQEVSAWVGHTDELLKEIENVRSGMASLESGQRGYLILGDERLLEQRKEIKAIVQKDIDDLGQLAADDPRQLSRLNEIATLIGTRTDFGEQTILVRRQQGFPAARTLLATGTGIALTGKINQLLIAMRNDEYALLVTRQQQVSVITTATFLLLPMGVYLSLTILLLALFFLNAGLDERAQAEEKLHESEKQFGTMVNAIPQLAWMARADGFIFWYNQRWFDYTGTTSEQMEGWGWQRVHDPDLLPKVLEGWKGAISSGQPFDMEFPLRAADGHYGWFLTRVFPFKDAAGCVVRWFGTNTDVSQKRAAAEEIRRLNTNLEQRVTERTAELESANRELEAFSYSVSHDLRAPLRAVDGFSQAVLEDYAALLPEQGRHDLQTIREGAQRMGTLIDDLLTFSRLSRTPLNRQEVNTRELVAHVIEGMNSEREGRPVEIRIGDLPASQGDPALLKQAWVNLLSNALKYTRHRQPAIIEIGAKLEQNETVYFVRDNGAGFDMRYVDKLFGVFQRLHRKDEFEGTGVGLAIVQRIIHRHSGRIWADAALQRGATFYFTLKERTPA